MTNIGYLFLFVLAWWTELQFQESNLEMISRKIAGSLLSEHSRRNFQFHISDL